MTTAGLLTVRANVAQGHLVRIAVELRRPAVTQLFLGQSPDAVVQRVPHLYSLCAQAQTAAAQAALAVAADRQASPVDHTLLWVELLHENLWRLLLDWPPVLGLAPAKAAFIAWRAKRLGPDCALHTQALLRDTLADLAHQCLERMEGHADLGSDAAAPFALQPQAWFRHWAGADAAQPAVAAPLSIGAAYQARLAQVRQAALALTSGAPYPLTALGEAGTGLAQTVTARGVLTHAVQLAQGLVQQYRVWAPTDVFFADAAALVVLLGERPCASMQEARQALEQAVLALDPCVPYVVEMSDA